MERLLGMRNTVIHEIDHLQRPQQDSNQFLSQERPLHCPLGRAAPKHDSNRVC